MNDDYTYTLNLTTAQLVALQMAVDTRIDWVKEQHQAAANFTPDDDDRQKLDDWLKEEAERLSELKRMLETVR